MTAVATAFGADQAGNAVAFSPDVEMGLSAWSDPVTTRQVVAGIATDFHTLPRRKRPRPYGWPATPSVVSTF